MTSINDQNSSTLTIGALETNSWRNWIKHWPISALEKENEQLKAKLRALHQKQFKANKKKHTTKQSADSCNHVKKKKRGAPKGHPGWSRRKADHIDKTVLVPAPQNCPYCKCTDLQPVEEIKDHLQEDIFRKICFGTRSSQGSVSHSVLPSLLMTARRQGQRPLSFFKILFTFDTATAHAALYNYSC